MKDFGLSRDVPVRKGMTALLFVDVQNYSAEDGGEYAGLDAATREERYGYFFREMRTRALPNMQRLQQACRTAGVEVMYTVIESLTLDGRDMGLDYKISGLFCPKGSRDAQVLEAIMPVEDEIIIPKTSSSPFISTNLHYVLGNLGVKHLIVCGVLTDQCVDSTVRDACDHGYLVTLVTDACATHSEERQHHSLANNHGYCRQLATDALIAELAALS
ncbi:isochorismatase family cysteine hydrolase [Acidihalobacter ferrooxydans]|uniref:Isochorismatase n=1 Tax=Acidihalobacter ferrooxydans TaxID=1765967 RepID=A0A1P8UE09_9GAMM|nr:isochorismatase family cysteine hydrolase [Acidihalobacter ferrooxydans]APZ42102.1 isochorismatase [Acidihalobacter ferrooxydans]